MAVTFDEAKRGKALQERGLDFADAALVLAGPRVEFVDDRFDYGEERRVTFGLLHERMVCIVWTSRGRDQHVISMRKANDREQRRYGAALRQIE